MLSKKQLKQLRSEIVLNSLFLKDYSNTLYIKEKTACTFFNSYIDYLYNLAIDSGYIDIDDDRGHDVLDIIHKYDNINNLYDYYTYQDEFDPLPQDDYIASLCEDNFGDGIVIYYIDDYMIISGYVFNVFNHIYESYIPQYENIKQSSLHYDNKKDAYYFIRDHKRYYINDFMKVSK